MEDKEEKIYKLRVYDLFMESLEEMIKSLPPELKQEAKDFIEYLMQKRQYPKKGKKLSLDWAGGLKKYRSRYSVLELEEKALEWWGR